MKDKPKIINQHSTKYLSNYYKNLTELDAFVAYAFSYVSNPDFNKGKKNLFLFRLNNLINCTRALSRENKELYLRSNKQIVALDKAVKVMKKKVKG